MILLAILYYNYRVSRSLALSDAQNDAKHLTELTVARIENVLQDVETVSLTLANVIENRDSVFFIGTRQVVKNILVKNPIIYGASVAFAPSVRGRDTLYFAPYLHTTGDSVVFKNLAEDSYRYTEKEWYVKARDEGRGVWSEPYFDEGGGEVLMATYSVPFYRIRGGEKRFAGVVTADLSMEALQNLIRGIQFYDSGEGMLISSEGNIVSWPGITVEQKRVFNVFDLPGESLEMRALLQSMAEGEQGITSLRGIAKDLNEHRWVSYAPVPAPGWSLGIMFDEDELYHGLHRLSLELAAIGLLGFLLLGIMIFVISRRFVKPVEKLASATRKIGQGDLDFQIPFFRSQDEIAELGQSFQSMQRELKDYIRNLRETTAQKEKMESELAIAAGIQQQMLPREGAIAGRNELVIQGLLKPARQIGGDLYDFQMEGDHLYFTIGDVSGKGIPAALFMAKTLTLFRAKVSKLLEPVAIASEINNDLGQNNDQAMFVTCFIGKLNIKTGKLIYTNAGHNPPLITGRGESPEFLNAVSGLPLGSMPDTEYRQELLQIQPEYKIILYTDGITEAENLTKDLFGSKRLEGIVKDYSSRSIQELCSFIATSVNEFTGGAEQSDDITILGLEYK